jgi:antitoxin CcdA
MTSVAKRKLSISLDADLVRELESLGESVSTQINAVLREDLARRARRQCLIELLDRLDETHGPVDEEGVRRFEELLT